MNVPKLLHIKNFIILIVLIIVSVPNIKAQCNDALTYSDLCYKLAIQNFNYKIKLPSVYNFQYEKALNFATYCDSLQLNHIKLNFGNVANKNYNQPIWFNFSSKNTDSLHYGIMNKRTINLIPLNINFNCTPSPTTFQSLGILFMGITRTVLFPTAPDYKIE